MARETFLKTDLFKLVEKFLKRRGIEMDEVRSIRLGADATLATVTVELIYGEHERPSPIHESAYIGKVRITSRLINEADDVQEATGGTSAAQMRAVLAHAAACWGLEVVE